MRYASAWKTSLSAIRFSFYCGCSYLDHYVPFSHGYILKIHVYRVFIHYYDINFLVKYLFIGKKSVHIDNYKNFGSHVLKVSEH